MVKPQICRSEEEIRRVLHEHLEELVREKQGVRVDGGDGNPQVTGSVESYIAQDDARHDEEDRDALYIETERDSGYVFYVPHIVSLEVLPTRYPM